MNLPIPQDLSPYADQIDFEKYGLSPYQWEISVPFKDCILWSVVLSYLRSVDFKNKMIFEERVKQLTGNEFDPKMVKPVILNFNPFLNMYACFFHETLKKIVQSFKNILNNKRSTVKKERLIDQELLMISCLIKCNILLISLYDNSHQLFTPEDDNSSTAAAITLFRRELPLKEGSSKTTVKRFTFGLTADLSWKLRESALNSILKNFEIKRKIKKEILSLIDSKGKEKKVNLVITLLKNDCTHIVFKLYESPHIAAKFENAGFETDPRITDADGLSAFYYASQCSDKNLLYTLHNYAANSCYNSESTFRDPNPCIISNFKHLQEVIDEDFQKLVEAEQASLDLEDLRIFNECLAKLSEGILDIRKQNDNLAQEASRQKRIILHILERFDEFFSIGKLEYDILIPDLIENYTQHKIYYDNLDFTISLLFFDNIFLLKGLLSSPQPLLYSELESNFLLSTLTNKYFTTHAQLVAHKYEHVIKTYDLQSETYAMNLHIIPLLERLNLRQNIRNFCKILEESNNMDLVNRIPEEEIHQMLYNSPEIKDEFLIFRLQHYLRTALKTKQNSSQLSFVIQRALQVLGESIKIEQENPASFRHLLRSCLSNKTVSTLIQIRNVLSHLENYQFSFKFKTEENDIFFAEIQSELQGISKAFEIVYDIQRTRLIDFLINLGFKRLDKLKTSGDTNSLITSEKDIKRELQRRTSLSFEKKLYRYKILWGNLLDATQERLNALKNSNDSLQLVMKNMTDILYPLIYLMTFLHNTGKIANTSLLDDIQEQKKELDFCLCSSDVLKKTENLIGLSKNLLNFTSEQESEEQEVDVSVTKIEHFLKNLTGGYISDEEKNEILGEIPSSITERINANEKLVSSLEERIELNLEQVQIEFDNLFLNKHQKSNIKKSFQKYLKKSLKKSNEDQMSQDSTSGQSNEAHIESESYKKIIKTVKEASTPLKILHHIFEKKYVSESKLQLLYEEIEFSDKTKTKLSALMENSKKPEDDNIANLLNRICKLKKLSFDDRYEVAFLWEKAKSYKTKKYLVYKIVQRYFRESIFQASLEILWFDCVTILEEVDDFKDFWVKTSYLFNGIDVRNVLAHGDPLLESIGILDPRDFPSELVNKVLQLFEDYESIKALHDLWKHKKPTHAYEECAQCNRLKKCITCCIRWDKYSKLLTKNPKDLQNIETFLNSKN